MIHFPDAEHLTRVCAAALTVGICLGAGPQARPQDLYPRLIETRKIWDAAPHNAFTDLIRHRGRWYCAFREQGLLWVTYQSHERIGEDKFSGKSSIFVAKVKIRLRDATRKER